MYAYTTMYVLINTVVELYILVFSDVSKSLVCVTVIFFVKLVLSLCTLKVECLMVLNAVMVCMSCSTY